MLTEPRRDRQTEARAQSDVVGTILLIGVVTLTVSMVGTGLLSSMQASTADPQANLDGRVIQGNLTLVHRGGDSLNETELQVRVANDTVAPVTDFEDGEIVRGTDDGLFERGEQWRNTTTIPNGSQLEVWVIHEPSDTLLYDETVYRDS